MVDEISPDSVMIPARRIKVATDLGHVREGDHLIIVGNVVVALDTSRIPEAKPESAAARGVYRKKGVRPAIDRLSEKTIYNVIRGHHGITSILISDHLGFARGDTPARGKVNRLLQKLIQTGKVVRMQDDRVKLFRYQVSPDMASADAMESLMSNTAGV